MESSFEILVFNFFNLDVLKESLPYLWRGLKMTLLSTLR